LALLAMLMLGGCALPGTGPTAPARLAPHTPTATATPIQWMGAPHKLPTGWKVYYAPHFTLALPEQWPVNELALPDSTSTRPHITYRLYSPQDGLPNPGAVEEWDGLTSAQVQDEFCTPTADDTMRTVAGLSMRFSIGYGPKGTGVTYDPFLYDWTFISNHGTVYWFWFYVGPDGAVGHNLQLDRAVMETFAPQYATWGCA